MSSVIEAPIEGQSVDRQSTRWKLIEERFEQELSFIQDQGREPTGQEGACLARVRLALDFNAPLAAELELLEFEEMVRPSEKADAAPPMIGSLGSELPTESAIEFQASSEGAVAPKD